MLYYLQVHTGEHLANHTLFKMGNQYSLEDTLIYCHHFDQPLCQLRDMTWLHKCQFVRVNAQKMCLQSRLKSELLLTYGAHISLDTIVRGEMIVVVCAIQVALPTGFTLVSRQFLVDVLDVLVQASPGGESAPTVRTLKQPVGVFSADVLPQLLLTPKQ